MLQLGNWYEIKDGDMRGRDMLNRHYSARHYRTRRPKLFVGPGEKMVLMTPNSDAIFVWRKFKSDDGQQGINCAVFRNESPILSSDLIKEAMELAWNRWSDARLYTYVNPKRIKSVNPGYCFKRAGWSVCGETKSGLVVLEARPSNKRIQPTPTRKPLDERYAAWSPQ